MSARVLCSSEREAAGLRAIDRQLERARRISSTAPCWHCRKKLRASRAVLLADPGGHPIAVHVECARALLFQAGASLP